MNSNNSSIRAAIPSLDRMLRNAETEKLIERYGRTSVRDCLRVILDEVRQEIISKDKNTLSSTSPEDIVLRVSEYLASQAEPSLRKVFNLTGTVLHTNLGRAPLPQEAIDAMIDVASGASNLEFDLSSGKRGDRDSHLEDLLCSLTGAEAATVVNNNASAVILVLNTLALNREVPVSRGELIEIGGSFRIPDIMKSAGCQLVEVGTTNRTHPKDFANAISDKSGLLMKIHTSNYVVQGFTASVTEADLAKMAHDHELPLCVDLGSGTLIDFRQLGLPYEPTVAETLSHGVDLVTFSGDKLLGGPQAGLIVGKADLISKIKRNPMKRAMRLDKITIAALCAVLRLYLDPDRIASRLPTLKLLTRPVDDIDAQADRLIPKISQALKKNATVEKVSCHSQIGSGSLPVEYLHSIAISLRPEVSRKQQGVALDRLAEIFRELPVPVIGRRHQGALLMDLRCLEDEKGFADQLAELNLNSWSDV